VPVNTVWITVVGVAAICVLLRVAAPLALGEHMPVGLTRALSLAVAALLARLVVHATFANGHHLTIDARLAGVTAGLLVALARKPLLLALLIAALATALVRVLTG
jgi:hypothetical protein